MLNWNQTPIRTSLICTSLLWAATAIIFLLSDALTRLVHAAPYRLGVILSTISTVIALCTFAYKTEMGERKRIIIYLFWLTTIYAATDNAPFIPTKTFNTIAFIAFAVTLIKRRRAERRRSFNTGSQQINRKQQLRPAKG